MILVLSKLVLQLRDCGFICSWNLKSFQDTIQQHQIFNTIIKQKLLQVFELKKLPQKIEKKLLFKFNLFLVHLNWFYSF